MRVQEKTKKHKDNFNKKDGIVLSDNKQDEMMANVLELYPKQTSYMLMGEEGAKKRSELQKDVRKYFNKLQDDDDALNAIGGRKKDRKGLKKVGRTIARASLAVPRGAGIALIRLNFRGFAKRFDLLNSEGEEKIMKKWEQMGGKRDKLASAIEAGKGKKIIVCGKKCRAKAGANPKISSNISDEKLNVAGVDDAGYAATIAAGIGTLTALVNQVGSGINNKKNYKNTQDLMKLEADLNQKNSEENAVDATMTPSERKIAEEIVKAQEAGNDPIIAIKNNTNLTAEEKAEAIKQLEGMQKSNIGIDTNKKFILLGVLLIAGFVGWSLYKNKQTNS
jgi:hypothetical protein